MKKKFSNKWKGSKQVRKQRKYRASAPLHIKHKLLSTTLDKNLRKKYNRRNFPLRKGDTVIVMKGSFKKKKGKIAEVDVKNCRVAIEGIQRKKQDGTKVNVFFNPSNLKILELNLDDKMRIKGIERKLNKEKEK